jgi:hypothetical protein
MAAAGAAGLDALVIRYYATERPTERTMIRDIFKKAIEFDGERREDQANRIISALSDALNKKSNKAHTHG